jgi:hypothetical protein
VTTHRRYYFEKEPAAAGHDVALRLLQHACETWWWFNEPEVTGLGFERLCFSFTVSARDQWWAHTRAMRLAEKVWQAVGVSPAQMPDPIWEPLAPHDNRGRFRVPHD